MKYLKILTTLLLCLSVTMTQAQIEAGGCTKADPCQNVTCLDNQTCIDALCYCNDATATNYEALGECQYDLCASAVCEPCFTCNPETGACDPDCPDGVGCNEDGVCDNCVGVNCAENEICVDAVCLCNDPNACNYQEVAPCIFADTGNCLDCDEQTTCETGFVCDGNGNCVVDCTPADVTITKELIRIGKPEVIAATAECVVGGSPTPFLDDRPIDEFVGDVQLTIADCRKLSSTCMGNCGVADGCDDVIATGVPVDGCMCNTTLLYDGEVYTYFENGDNVAQGCHSFFRCNGGTGTGIRVNVSGANNSDDSCPGGASEGGCLLSAYFREYCVCFENCGETILEYRFSSSFCDEWNDVGVDYRVLRRDTINVVGCVEDGISYEAGDTLVWGITLSNLKECEVTELTWSDSNTELIDTPTTLPQGGTVVYTYPEVAVDDQPLTNTITVTGSDSLDVSTTVTIENQ